ncbi:MAG: 2-isopropylmalate synthase [Lachnospiraceae bacterium]|nr:2-isopropylmalate synthase [Lachnospiraceae bacterium]MBR2275931.1 2-isopropylmalate synthase [Lachnospiraceae bacterium]
MLNYKRYKKNPVLQYPEREWPNKEIEKAPVWCSVDLRDGNQALIDPMIVEEKIEFFELLVKLGFKEIEIGFPAASQIEYDFLRQLVDRKLIPDDVWVQVLTQCREEQIERTFESIEGIKNVIVHIYNSTSVLQRDVVFNMDKDGITEIATNGVKWVKEREKDFPGNIILEYSPESFTGTEVEYALEICTAVQREWGATKDRKVIINLPATVELNTPNVYADQIEWMNKHFENRESIILSVHPHNDRGTGIAATELALLAGAERVEGTLLGNGERTGNIDILNIAYNMFSQGINPELAIEDINEITEAYERLIKMPIDDRHPYAGKLVFTAFSGSHQDAINKGVRAMKERKQEIWQVPYLPIDPSDIGRRYEPIVRINSQSGKGGVAFIMDTYFGFKLPKGMHKEFAKVIQGISENQGEVSPDQIMAAFKENYIDRKEPLHFKKLRVTDNMAETPASSGKTPNWRNRVDTDNLDSDFDTRVVLEYTLKGKEGSFEAVGNGPIDAVIRGLRETFDINIKVLDYEEHALQGGANAQAAAYIHLLDADDGRVTYGVGVSSNITRASVRAMFSAINRLELLK